MTALPTAVQISESFKRFGVSADVTSLLVARFDATSADVSDAQPGIPPSCSMSRGLFSTDIALCDLQHDAVERCIEGDQAGLDSLPTLIDAAAVSKVTAEPATVSYLRSLRALSSRYSGYGVRSITK